MASITITSELVAVLFGFGLGFIVANLFNEYLENQKIYGERLDSYKSTALTGVSKNE